MRKLIKLHPDDNVQIAAKEIKAGEPVLIDQNTVGVDKTVQIGHKIAGRPIANGQKIIKYGVPIGSATAAIAIGAHIHLHNMKSDYIPTYTVEEGFKEGTKQGW